MIEEPGTNVDLIEDARRAGFPVTPRLITDWIDVGLLNTPTRRSQGRGRGSAPALHSAHQRNLFLALLRLRQQTTQIAPLCNVPVWLWLTWGDEYVPLRATRRAMNTWGKRIEHVNWETSQRNAKQLVDQIAHPDLDPTIKAQLVEAIANSNNNPRSAIDLNDQFHDAVDPDHQGRTIGPSRATGRHIAALTARRLDALTHLRELSDDTYLFARDLYTDSWTHFTDLQPIWECLAAPAERALFSEVTEQQRIQRACLDLLSLLGAAMPPP